MKRERGRWWPALLAVALLVSACSSPPVRQVKPEEVQAARPGELISIRLLGTADSVMTAVISAFYAKYPDYRVELIPYATGSNSLADRIEAQIAAGEVDLVPVNGLRELVQEGLLMPLDPLIQKHQVDLAASSVPAEQIRMDGKLYELPYVAAPVVLTYNKDLFQAAGLPDPGAGWTWDRFREAALRLSEGTGQDRRWGFGTVPGDTQLLSMYMAGRSGGSLRKVEDRVVGDALQFFSTLVFTDQSMPVGPLTGVVPSYMDLFTQGKAAMGLWQLGQADHLGPVPFRWDVAPIPAYPGEPATTLAYLRTLGIAANSKNPEAAFTFLRFLAGPEGALAVAQAGSLPALRTPEIQRTYLDRKPGPPPGAASTLEMRFMPAPRGTDTSPVGKRLAALSRSVEVTLSGERSWEEALAQYQREVERIDSETK